MRLPVRPVRRAPRDRARQRSLDVESSESDVEDNHGHAGEGRACHGQRELVSATCSSIAQRPAGRPKP